MISKLKKLSMTGVTIAALGFIFTPAFAVDYTNGLMTAVPIKNGQPPTIDGDLSDWDLSAAEPAYIAPQSARMMNTEWALMYDQDALYVSVKTSLPNRPQQNPSNPQDAFWSSDIVQLRLVADPAIKYPIDRARDSGSEAVAHISFWKNSETGKDYVHINRGTTFANGQEVMPEGATVSIKTDGSNSYTVESRLPWAALRAPGGKFPFGPGQRMTAIAETLWIGGDQARVALNFNRNPGTFAFNSPATWGQVEFAAQSLGARRRPAMAAILAELNQPTAQTGAPAVGVPFTVQVPADGLKTSVNILGPNGEVVRELMGGESHPKGALTLRWDGKDQWGKPVKTGAYRWGAYFSRGINAEFVGSAGSSGLPYSTMDGKGGWGGDHSNPIDVASDASGVYLLWPVAEAGRPIVKLDYNGNIIWRKKPFVGGGFGPHYSMASDGKTLYLTLGDSNIRLVRMDAITGELMTWGQGGPAELPILETTASRVPESSTPIGVKEPANVGPSLIGASESRGKSAWQPDAVGLATHNGKVYLPSYSGNKILVIDGASGKVEGDLSCDGPRGLAFDKAGHLYAVSYLAGRKAQIVRFANAAGTAQTVVSSGLEAPYGVTLDAANRIYVSDLGQAQQIKVFNAQGAPVKTFGKAGGRAWQGKYDAKAFLKPAGIAIDERGGLLVAESSPPKPISRLKASDGSVQDRWFGPGIYWNAAFPMPDDPRHLFYSLTHALGRGRIVPAGETGVPDAYWAPDKAGYEFAGDIEAGIPQPEVMKGSNGRLYLAMDGGKHPVYLFDGDLLRPVSTWERVGADKKRFPQNTTGKPYIDVWIDSNGDGQQQEAEKSRLTDVNGEPMVEIATQTSSMHMEPNGDLYFATQGNRILKVPAAGFHRNGVPRWETGKATYAVPAVLAGLDRMHTTNRHGILGVRVDSAGNIYTAFNTRLTGGSSNAHDYPSKEYADMMRDGMGHTSGSNVVKFAKYDKNGQLLWMAGRKALAGAKAGEIYHHWNVAGLVNDRYIASASEWGTISLYTADGFYVDTLMNNPGEAPPPGPYTFGGETAGGRVQYFPKSGELWAYSLGKAYRVNGFANGQIAGESRASGTVELDKIYESAATAAAVKSPLQLVNLSGNPLQNAALWNDVPTSTLQANGAELAKAQIAYDAQNLYARIQVTDASPLENEAEQLQLAFKGGDTAGIVLGPVGDRSLPAAGDIRFMAARINGQPKLIAMKAVTTGVKAPFEYFTPAAGTRRFEFVGEVPNAQLQLVPTANGYTATFSVPRSFLEFDLKAGANLIGDIEVRLSGAGGRGLQAVSRNYLFTPSRTETTMTDDVPTEARLYPQYWGTVEVK